MSAHDHEGAASAALLSVAEAEALAKARGVLSLLVDRAGSLHGASSNMAASSLGRAAATARTAEAAIFDVLNTVGNWCRDPVARDFFHVRLTLDGRDLDAEDSGEVAEHSVKVSTPSNNDEQVSS